MSGIRRIVGVFLAGLDRLDQVVSGRAKHLILGVCALGVGLRAWLATGPFLSPEEAWYCLIANAPDLSALIENTRRANDSPLLIVLLSVVKRIGPGELAVRSLQVVSGGLTAGLMYLWLARRGAKSASMFAVFALALAPAAIALDSGVRAEPLLMLFMAAGLLALDRAIDGGSARWMSLFVLCLCLAILSGFGGGVFATAAGFYYLIRVSEPSVNAWTRRVWTIGQVGAGSLFWLLYSGRFNAVDAERPQGAAPWLAGLYPAKGDDPFFHLWSGTLGQFSYGIPSLPSALFAMALFASALVYLGRRDTRRSAATVVLLTTPFVVSYILSFLHIAPYGASRETAYLTLFVVAGVAIGTEAMPRWRVIPAVVLALLLMPLWHLPALQDRYGAPSSRNSREQMEKAVAFLRASVPEGALVVTDVESRLSVGYYLDPYGWIPRTGSLPTEDVAGGVRLWASRWSFSGPEDLQEDLSLVRSQGLESGLPIWVVDGGYENKLGESIGAAAAGQEMEARDFGGVVIIIRTPPGVAESRLTGPEIGRTVCRTPKRCKMLLRTCPTRFFYWREIA